MAQFIPFKGILYNPEKVANLSDVVTPPYDVISEQEQNQYYERHPYNMIRLILNKPTPSDTPLNNPHIRSAQFFKQWTSERILIRDQMPAFYLTSVTFPTYRNNHITRYGLIGLVRIEPFEKGIILPHEKTFSRVRSERFELMKTCHTNYSPIFSLFMDTNGDVFQLAKSAVESYHPDMDFYDDKGHHHRLWRITNHDTNQVISNIMRDKKIFIADGHHRYETAMDYRNWIAQQTPDFSESHPANYVMMYLTSMQDPGLMILPAHRMLKEIKQEKKDQFIQIASRFFHIQSFPFKTHTYEKVRSECISQLTSNQFNNTLGVFIHGQNEMYLLTLKDRVMDKLYAHELPESLRYLDVSVLTRLIFMEILGFDHLWLDNDQLISYSSIAEQALDAAYHGACDAAFILNPTRIDQVRRVAEEGLIMPRKSTYFYPKVITGQVINSLIPE